jgi:DNA gyrase subunit B
VSDENVRDLERRVVAGEPGALDELLIELSRRGELRAHEQSVPRGLQWHVFNVVRKLADHGARHFELTLRRNGFLSLTSDGPGISVEWDREDEGYGRPILERLFLGDTRTWAREVQEQRYQSGADALCALTLSLDASTTWSGRRFRQRFEHGLPTHNVADLGPTSERGTRVDFRVDQRFFRRTPTASEVSNGLDEVTWPHEGVEIGVADE